MPAGNLEKLKTAVLYGADAIYMGTPDLSLRVKSEMSLEDVVEGIAFAHKHGKRVYLTLNLFSHNKDIERLPIRVFSCSSRTWRRNLNYTSPPRRMCVPGNR